MFHLTSLSLAVYLRPSNGETIILKWPEEITEAGRTISECITVIGVLGYILIQLGGEIVNIGLLSFLKQLVCIAILFPGCIHPSPRVSTVEP